MQLTVEDKRKDTQRNVSCHDNVSRSVSARGNDYHFHTIAMDDETLTLENLILRISFDMRCHDYIYSSGAGSTMADDLTQEWQRLDSDEYPGAGPESLTADGIIDPLLAYAYDAIFVAAAAVPLAREDIVGNLTGIELDR